MNELYLEMVRYLAMPGKLSNQAWQDAYFVRGHVESGKEELFLWGMISVLSRVARSRRERLPDVLHNMMILNSGGVRSENRHHVVDSKEKVQNYIKMLGCTK